LEGLFIFSFFGMINFDWNMKRSRKILLVILSVFLVIAFVYIVFLRDKYPAHVLIHSFKAGDSLDSFHGVTVYNNGTVYGKSYGRHYNADSTYYYGKKWQCVEFIKRYYHDYLHHEMKDGFGNAHSFFDSAVPQGGLNERRNLLQFRNGDGELPRVNDILVFDGSFGHVAIVTRVEKDYLEVIQQNIYLQPRDKYTLTRKENKYTVGTRRRPMGWLRLPSTIH
jgi:hypothetical protein